MTTSTIRVKTLADMQRVMDEIASDMQQDAINFDGKPFNGRTVAEYFGNQGAAIAAIAKAVKELSERVEADELKR